jgi:phosphoadenosine phosphosulfate reductase
MTLNEQMHPKEIIRWALEQHPDLLMTSAFNLNGVVLIDQAVRAGYRGEIVFVDTGQHFAETLETRDRIIARYPELNVVTLRAAEPLHTLPPCGANGCCLKRKVEPLRAYLAQKQPSALLTARSRFQSDTRAELGLIEQTPERIKINPLVSWTREQLERYARAFELPINPLYAQGYLSIGCAPTTRAVAQGEGVRAGRWAGQEKTECGLWWGEKSL